MTAISRNRLRTCIRLMAAPVPTGVTGLCRTWGRHQDALPRAAQTLEVPGSCAYLLCFRAGTWRSSSGYFGGHLTPKEFGYLALLFCKRFALGLLPLHTGLNGETSQGDDYRSRCRQPVRHRCATGHNRFCMRSAPAGRLTDQRCLQPGPQFGANPYYHPHQRKVIDGSGMTRGGHWLDGEGCVGAWDGTTAAKP
jgi:hypothetical protein